MSRAIVWTAADRGLDDGYLRRRTAIPAPALGALGWRAATPMDGRWPADVAAVVVDLAGADAAAQAQCASELGIPWYAELTRWLETRARPSAAEWAALADLAAGARRCIAPSTEARDAVVAGLPGARIGVVPDPLESSAAVRLAATHLGQPFQSPPLASHRDDLVIWWAEPEDDGAAELEALRALFPDIARAGCGLLILAHEDIVFPVQTGIRIERAPWTLQTQFAQISRARCAVFPAIARSLPAGLRRRVNKALFHGLPVVGPLADGMTSAADVVLDDWTGGLARLAGGDLEVAAATAQRRFASATDAALAWDAILTEDQRTRQRRKSPVRLLVLADLIQDVDLCAPIIEAAAAQDGVEPRLVLTDWLIKNSPRALAEAQRLGMTPEIVERSAMFEGRAPRLWDVDAVLTPAATNLNPHKFANALIESARAAGLPTFSLQHGLENVGISYVDERHSADVRITSDYVFVWFAPDFAPASSSRARARFLYVGTVKGPSAVAAAPMASFGRPVVAVFENLHWHRYDEDFRRRFVIDLQACAAAFPERLFLLKPHHAGRWAVKATWRGAPKNLQLVDPQAAAWEAFTAPAIIHGSEKVITTPSTVALDAVLEGQRVAVAGYGLDLPSYEPLPILRSGADWIHFVAQEADNHDDRDLQRAFMRRNVLRASAAAEVIETISRLVRAGRLGQDMAASG